MAYTVPTQVVTGALETAADFNTDVIDNITALWPFTANYQVPYRSSATTLGAAPGRVPLVCGGYSRTANSNSETTIATVTVPGGYLSTNQAIFYEAFLDAFNNVGADRTLTVKIYYGATSLSLAVTMTNSANLGQALLRGWCVGYNATNAQKLAIEEWHILTGAGARGTGLVLPAAAAEDSTADKTAKITLTMSAASASTYFTVLHTRISAMPIA